MPNFRKQEQVIEMMCKSALPSTLVKALYLFFDLPPPADGDATLSKQKLFVVFQKVTFFPTCSHGSERKSSKGNSRTLTKSGFADFSILL